MKKLLILILLIGIGIGIYIPVGAQGGQPNPISSAPDKVMVVIYLTTGKYLQSFIYEPDMILEEYGDKLYLNGEVIVNNLNEVNWTFFQYQPIEVPFEVVDGVEVPLDITMGELGLSFITADSLPHSQHIAIVKSIDPQRAKPVTVTRRWIRENYDENCLISESIWQLYILGKVGVGDYVIVSFIEEHPNSQELNIPVVVDMVKVTW